MRCISNRSSSSSIQVSFIVIAGEKYDGDHDDHVTTRRLVRDTGPSHLMLSVVTAPVCVAGVDVGKRTTDNHHPMTVKRKVRPNATATHHNLLI